MQWKPHATVAAIVETKWQIPVSGRGKPIAAIALNQPAGHLEDNETILQAVIRETLEETAYAFEPTSLLGIYHWKTRAQPYHLPALCLYRQCKQLPAAACTG